MENQFGFANFPLEADNNNYSMFGEDTDGFSLKASSSSAGNFPQENGRRYHALSEGKYMLPNDEFESNRLDLQNHLFKLTFDGKSALCPGAETAQRVLDIGTGTGIWAIEYADNHPTAKFETDDVEKDWAWHEDFDFIFSRMMSGCFADVPKVLAQAFENIQPGGYFEFQDNYVPVRCDDDTLPESSALLRWSKYIVEASVNLGRPISVAQKYKSQMEAAGFVDVVELQFKWPQNTWPKEQKYKELGMWTLANVDDGLGATMALFTRGLGWKMEEVLELLGDVRKEIRNSDLHAYWLIYVVYGRKPKFEE